MGESLRYAALITCGAAAIACSTAGPGAGADTDTVTSGGPDASAGRGDGGSVPGGRGGEAGAVASSSAGWGSGGGGGGVSVGGAAGDPAVGGAGGLPAGPRLAHHECRPDPDTMSCTAERSVAGWSCCGIWGRWYSIEGACFEGSWVNQTLLGCHAYPDYDCFSNSAPECFELVGADGGAGRELFVASEAPEIPIYDELREALGIERCPEELRRTVFESGRLCTSAGLP